tara:strand:+ start:864 stop:1241 length:378 start_codon:yes stop_codon:yes gene_type:complete
VLTSTSTALSIYHDLNKFVVVGLNLSMLILLGFDKFIDPQQKAMNSHNISIEFQEIYREIKQYINENNKSEEQIKSYSRIILHQMNVWISLAPPSRYVKEATKICTKRIKKQTQQSKKIDIDVEH